MEDLDDGKKLIARKHIVSPTKVLISIAAKNMLKLLKNDNIQLSLGATYGAAWSRWILHVCGIVGAHHRFHPAACVFASNETTMSYEFLLESIL